MRSWSFAKGQATLNDFIVVNDRHGLLSPSREDVRFLCDRRSGIGADGLLRAIKASHVEGWEGAGDIWYMDARSADGHEADFGGNGLRVFVRYLRDAGLVASDVVRVATRHGERQAEILPDGRISTRMGTVRTCGVADVICGDDVFPGTRVYMNEKLHVACPVEHVGSVDPAETRGLVSTQLDHHPLRNVEYYEVLSHDRIKVRAWQTGIGETVSIGSGAVAAAAAQLAAIEDDLDQFRCKVDVRGGRLEVVLDGGDASLIGPAVLVARGDVMLPDSDGDE